MSSYQTVIICGNLGRDPEIRTVGETEVASFSVATSESWKDKNGQRQERTEWHRIVLWRKLAEVARNYLSKGDKVLIRGKIQSREYDDSSGQRRTAYEIVGQDLQMLGRPNNGAPSNGNGGHSNGNGAPSNGRSSTPTSSAPTDDDFPW